MKKTFLILFLFIFAPPLFAGNNLIITCSDSSCIKSSDLPLFNESNIAPGFSNTQNIKIINNRSDSCDLLFKLNRLSSADPLSSVQMLTLTRDNFLWYSGTLHDLSDNKTHELGNIDSSQYKEYQWTFSLNQSVGNEYQLQNNTFDVDFNFTCNEESSDNLFCHDSAPSQIPQNLKATSGQNSVTLTWDEATDDFTYYLIAYGEDEHAATYANPHIGGRGTNSYIINNLSAGTIYFFKIRTGNGCAQGPFSTIVSATPGGQTLFAPLPATSFNPGILGVQSTIPTTSSAETANCIHIFPYAFILALILNLILKPYHIVTLIISLLSLTFDYYLAKYTCQKYPYFYLFNLFSFVLPLILSFKKNHKKLY